MKVLFVCTGNTCRSPMAQVLARRYLGGQDTVFSAGINAWEGDMLSRNAAEVLREQSLGLSGHRAVRLTTEMLASADVIFTMTKSQEEYLTGKYPDYKNKIKALGDAAGFSRDVADPFGGSLEVYRRCLQELDQMVRTVAAKLKSD